ncbi:MAG: transporter [Novosphingobium sp.]
MRLLPPSLLLIAALAVPLAAPAHAEERDFCANRPGLNTPACTLAPGESMAELGLLTWDHQEDVASRDDRLTLGNTTLRIGLNERSELELGFTPYVHDRQRDKLTGAAMSESSTGDGTSAWRRGLAGPNGPIAVQAYVTLPVGRSPGAAGDWGAGLLVPMGFNLGHGFQLEVTPEADAAVNASGSGRHLAFGSAAGLSHPLGKSVALTVEANVFRDLDPSGHDTLAEAAVSLAWQAGKTFQLDLEMDKRLAGGVPDHSLKFGLAKRFP